VIEIEPGAQDKERVDGYAGLFRKFLFSRDVKTMDGYLPLHYNIDENDVRHVVSCIDKFVARFGTPEEMR
jgi:hypothetical protein